MRLLHDCHRATRGQRRRALHRVQTPRVTRHGLPARMLPCRCARSHSALTESTSLWPSARRCRPGRLLRPTPARRSSMPPPIAPLRAQRLELAGLDCTGPGARVRAAQAAPHVHWALWRGPRREVECGLCVHRDRIGRHELPHLLARPHSRSAFILHRAPEPPAPLGALPSQPR